MAYDKNTDIDGQMKYLNSLISKGGGNGEWAKSEINKLNSYVDSAKPKETTYYNPSGEKQYGYKIDDKTYKDQQGTQRIDEGSYVNTGDNWWQMGATGGAKVDVPNFAKTLDYYGGDYSKMLGGMNYSTGTSKDMQQTKGQIGDLISALQTYQGEKSMSKDESNARAYAQLNNQYNAGLDKTLDNYNKDAVSRGMFGQLPIEALKANAMSESELNKASAISDLGNSMYTQDFDMARQKDQDFYNKQKYYVRRFRTKL